MAKYVTALDSQEMQLYHSEELCLFDLVFCTNLKTILSISQHVSTSVLFMSTIKINYGRGIVQSHWEY